MNSGIVLVTGSGGQLGNEIKALSNRYPEFKFHFTNHEILDITDKARVNDWFEQNEPEICINAAAYTAVDKAESEYDKALAVNCIGAKNIAEACAKHNTLMVHISTDYVFDGAKNIPYKETDPVNPLGAYGKTKLLGETAVLESKTRSIIIRTSWLYSSFGKNIVKTVLRLASERPQIKFVFDQIGSPTYAGDLAEAILNIISNPGHTQKTGLYHYCNQGVCSWYDFAKAIIELKGFDCDVSPIETHEYPVAAKRPPYSVFNTGKIKEDFGLDIPYWRNSLAKCLDKIQIDERN